MTSNVGAREISAPTTLGFSPEGKAGLSDKEIKSRVMGEVKKLFRPEFLNRIDEIIVFKSLTQEQIVEIAKLMVADLRERLIAQNMTINLTDDAYKLIAKEGTDAAYGARPLRRAIQRLLEDPLSEELLEGGVDVGLGHPGKRFRGRREPCVRPRHGLHPCAAQARQHRARRRASAHELRSGPRRRLRLGRVGKRRRCGLRFWLLPLRPAWACRGKPATRSFSIQRVACLRKRGSCFRM